jgi:hypothetical protein
VVLVWTRAAGRCEFRGCNEPLWKDLLTTNHYNRAKIGHIIAASADGPRGHPVLSPRLVKDPTNLMLLCGTHHDQVDDRNLVTQFPVELLREYKREHHDRIEALTGISEATKSIPVVLQVPVHIHAAAMPVDDVKRAISGRRRYPDEPRRVEISLLGITSRDHDAAFWTECRTRIRSIWETRLAALAASGPIGHISVFAFAPIPLLIDFGRLVGDKLDADVFNYHRKPKGWVWPTKTSRLRFSTELPANAAPASEVALAISISSVVQTASVASVIPPETPVFHLRASDPAVDALRSPEDLHKFVQEARAAMEAIHRTGASRIHVFGGIPVAAAVEFGRCLLPKLHGELVLYDYNSTAKGWHRAFELGGAIHSHKPSS